MAPPIPKSLAAVRAALDRMLHLPDNVGIQLRPLSAGEDGGQRFLLLFVDGLADPDRIQQWVVAPLQEHGDADRLPAPQVERVHDLTAAVTGALDGATAVFTEGGSGAQLVNTARFTTRHQGSGAGDVRQDTFGLDFRENVALLRKRLRLPALVIRPIPVDRDRGTMAIAYVDAAAPAHLVAETSAWVRSHASEKGLRGGQASGWTGRLGLVPTFTTEVWPDKVATLVQAGYVAVLVDRVVNCFVAPVTAPSVLYSPDDEMLRLPVRAALRLARVVLFIVIILLPGLVVATLSYHQEMIPTPFLLAMAAARENRPFPVSLEIIGLALMQEVARGAAARLPGPIEPGQMLIADLLGLIVLELAGFIGPAAAVVTVANGLAIIALSNRPLVEPARVWRIAFIFPAMMFGAFGMAILLFILGSYLLSAQSRSIPFFGESGFELRPLGKRLTDEGGSGSA